ncbi:MAG TPA: FAD-binding protein, partial [Alphaproteobacteria bacterium]|nr:FAD-binding protein [Alphaproteobacteria bacterium]
MVTAIPIADEAAAREAILWALAERHTLEVRAQGSKRGLGRPPAADCVLDLSRLCGVVDYQPAELVLKARPATPLAEIETLTGGFHQRLAFEPPDYGPLYGGPPGQGTLGGALACNLSGPRRISAFAARDHFLGMRAVSGRGEAFKAGGSVVKNVTGYDLCKLLAGSYGTLAVLTEITVRVSPSAEKTRTVLIFGLDAARAVEALTAALASPFEVSGAAYLPASLARGSAVDYVGAAGAAVAALRLEGIAPSVLARTDALAELMAPFGAVEELHGKNSTLLWREVRDGALLPSNAALWRVSLPPAQAPAFLAAIGA